MNNMSNMKSEGPLFRFTPASGFWGSLPVLGSVVFGIATLFALPAHLVLHRRIGERYLNLFIVIAAGAAWELVAMLLQPLLTQLILYGKIKPWIPIEVLNTVLPHQLQISGLCVIVLYCCHRFGCWKRERADDLIHSRSWGVPTYLLPSKVNQKASAAALAAKPTPAPTGLYDELIRDWKAAWAQMVADYNNKCVPSGPMAWAITTILQPIALMLIGVILCLNGLAIGASLFVSGIGMIVQGRIVAAFFREQILDHRDSRLEQEVWTRIIRGEPSRAEQVGYAMPVATRSIPFGVRADIAARLRAIDPSLAEFLKPAAVVEGKEHTVNM